MILREVKDKSLADYVVEQTAAGHTALSQKVCRDFKVSLGSLFLMAPEALQPGRIENWNWDPGGVAGAIADDLLAKYVVSYTNDVGNRVYIQDFEQRRSDPRFEDDPLMLFHIDEIYWQIGGEPRTTFQKVLECIRDASCWPWLGYFSKARAGNSRLLTEQDLEEIASRLVGVAVQALHDSYVLWWRTDIEPLPSVLY
jgi:hypothetical protein